MVRFKYETNYFQNRSFWEIILLWYGWISGRALRIQAKSGINKEMIEKELMISKEPITKSEIIPSTEKAINYYDFKSSEMKSNYSYIKTDIIESGIV